MGSLKGHVGGAIDGLLRVHSLWAGTRVNGPGLRFLVHVQGCSRRCPGCFNPETQDPCGGWDMSPQALAERVTDAVRAAGAVGPAMEGVTVSGGEPLEQAEALLDFLRRLRRRAPTSPPDGSVSAPDLSVVLYSGFTRAEIACTPLGRQILELTDVLIDGPFVQAQAVDDGVRGSANQTVHFLTSRYGPPDFPRRSGSFEVKVQPDGTVAVTGFPPVGVREAIARSVRGA